MKRRSLKRPRGVGVVAAPAVRVTYRPLADDLLADQLVRCASGDIEAFGYVYDATIGRLFKLALGATRDQETAERVTRQAYLEAWCWASRFDPKQGSAAAWLALIVWGQAVKSRDPSRRALDAGYHGDAARVV